MKGNLFALVLLVLATGMVGAKVAEAAGESSTAFLCGCIPAETLGGYRAGDESHGCQQETYEPYVGYGVKEICWLVGSRWGCTVYIFAPNADADITPVVAAVTQELATEAGVDVSQISVVGVEFHEWPNGSLGVTEVGKTYTSGRVSGWIITLSVEGWTYRYHTDGVCWTGFRWEPCTPATVKLAERIETPMEKAFVKAILGPDEWFELRSEDGLDRWYVGRADQYGILDLWIPLVPGLKHQFRNPAHGGIVEIRDLYLNRSPVDLHPDHGCRSCVRNQF